MNRELPRRKSGAPEIPHRSGTAALALPIRVATGLDEWADRDRYTGPSKPGRSQHNSGRNE